MRVRGFIPVTSAWTRRVMRGSRCPICAAVNGGVLEPLAQVSTANPRSGKPCGFALSTGNLSDCRKLYLDEAEDMDPRYRIVYRLLPDEDKPAKAEVIRIGLKVPYGDEEQIYRQVGRALDRLPGRE
jgi:hypothetical protein